MLATLHAQGIGLWGGSSFSRVNKFPHPGVNFLDFSPFERYMVTLSSIPIEAARVPSPTNPFTEDDEGNHIAVWEIATGRLLRTFPMAQETPVEGQAQPKKVFTWPILKWSGDEKYVARVTPGQSIQVYEAPEMYLLDKKSIKLDGVVDFEWAPLNEKELQEVEEEIRGAPLELEEDGKANGASAAKDKKKEKKKERENTLAYWLPENQNQPARVALMAIPSRENLRTKNLFNVADVRTHCPNFTCILADQSFRSTVQAALARQRRLLVCQSRPSDKD
jgi:translation initiation factor 3 subunit B